MTKQALLGAVLAIALVAGCKSATLEKTGEVPPQAPAAVPAPAPTPPTPAQAPGPSPEALARGYEILTLTAQIPPDVMAQAEQQADCPRTLVGALFGLEIANPHGCVIGRLDPSGLAAQAGLKVGDSIVACDGQQVDCPNTFVPLLRSNCQGPAQGRIVLTIHRPLPLRNAQ